MINVLCLTYQNWNWYVWTNQRLQTNKILLQNKLIWNVQVPIEIRRDKTLATSGILELTCFNHSIWYNTVLQDNWTNSFLNTSLIWIPTVLKHLNLERIHLIDLSDVARSKKQTAMGSNSSQNMWYTSTLTWS